MTYQLDFHEDVEKDSLKAYEWYEAESPGLGERFLEAVQAKLEQIARNPDTFGE